MKEETRLIIELLHYLIIANDNIPETARKRIKKKTYKILGYDILDSQKINKKKVKKK